jgi:hypothetical protein
MRCIVETLTPYFSATARVVMAWRSATTSSTTITPRRFGERDDGDVSGDVDKVELSICFIVMDYVLLIFH